MAGHDKVCTTSLIVGEMFEKEHKNVLRDIRNFECSEKFMRANFEPVEYVDAKGEKRPAFNITRDGFSFLTLGFTGKKAAAWKEKFLEAFNAMEKVLLHNSKPIEHNEGMERVIFPKKTITVSHSTHFNSRKTISKLQQSGLQGLMHFAAYMEEVPFETVEEYFLKISQIDSLKDLNAKNYTKSINALMIFVHIANKSVFTPHHETMDKVELTKNALYGLMDFWVYQFDNLTKKEIENYVLNICNISTLEELQTQKQLQKALFVVYRGIHLYVSIEDTSK